MAAVNSLGWGVCRRAEAAGGNLGGTDMWKTIGWLSLTCATFIGMLIAFSLIGLKT